MSNSQEENPGFLTPGQSSSRHCRHLGGRGGQVLCSHTGPSVSPCRNRINPHQTIGGLSKFKIRGYRKKKPGAWDVQLWGRLAGCLPGVRQMGPCTLSHCPGEVAEHKAKIEKNRLVLLLSVLFTFLPTCVTQLLPAQKIRIRTHVPPVHIKPYNYAGTCPPNSTLCAQKHSSRNLGTSRSPLLWALAPALRTSDSKRWGEALDSGMSMWNIFFHVCLSSGYESGQAKFSTTAKS